MTKPINTLFVGQVIHEFNSLDSTNQFALELLGKEKQSEGTLVLTYDQYAGRGQINNKWESAPGKNLTFTIILFPKFLPARNQFLLNQVVSLSVFDTLNDYIPAGLSIKWPNDIYVFNKKITGILIQNSLKGSTLQSSIVGIGLNVNQKQFISDAPNPTSMALAIGAELDLDKVLASFCEYLEKNYLQLKAGQTRLIKQRYLKHLFRFGKSFSFKRPDGTIFSGHIMGVTNIGKLIIHTPTGAEAFGFKEIGYIL